MERGTNERPWIWSCDLWANERPGNKFHWEVTDKHTHGHCDSMKLKKSIWPKKQESLPTGKLNNQGHMVTDTEEIKDLYLNEFKERLRSRPSHPEFVEIHNVKETIFKLKLEKAKIKVSSDWTMQELEDVLKDIKKGKSRDPEGISQDIFHPSVIGENLQKK